MALDIVRFGVVGLGMGMSRAKTITQTQGAKLVAVADLLEERRQKAKAEFGCDAYEDYHQMFDRDDIDCCVIMTPSGLHGKIGMEAAKRGKHVITTKPMDVSLENCDSLIKCCEDNKVKLLVDFGERYGNGNRRIKKALEIGALGRTILCELRMKWYRAEGYYEGWHGTWALDGGGSIMNQGVHQIDLMQWFMGPVESVLAGHIGVYAHKNVETEDLTTAIIKFKSGAIGTILTTTTCPKVATTMIQIHGEKGIVGKGPEVWEFVDDPPQIELPPYPKNITEDAIQVVRHGAKQAVDGYEGRKSVEINLAIYKSAQTGKEVRLSL